MPPTWVLVRSRAARSAADSSSCSPRVAGSTIRDSCPDSMSRHHRLLRWSVPDADRRNSTREPSGEMRNSLGVPRVNRWVRACWRRKESVVTMEPCQNPPAGAPAASGAVDGRRIARQAVVVTVGAVDAVANAVGTVAVAFEVAVGHLDAGGVRALGDEPDLDLAGVGQVG